jgi:CMP-N,N'-diacetyllegionaminic acid synthase
MLSGRRVLAIVPARGGSKGIPLKNLREIGGVPLVARVGHLLRELEFVDRAIVSTDHAEIARVAEAAGLAAPFVRPEDLSGPTIGDQQVLEHALRETERLDNVRYDIAIMLQPTSPSRTAGQVREAVTMLIEGGYDAVWTVSPTDGKAHPLKQLARGEDGRLGFYDPAGAAITARQQLKPVFHRNGIAYVFTRECLLDQKTIMGAKTGALLIDGPIANIDTEFDLEYANWLLARNERP